MTKIARRSFLRNTALSLTAGILGARSARATKAQRPNFVLFIADDISVDDWGCYGHPTLQTPQVDRLAEQGVRFENAYLTISSCSPSRTSLITGRYPHNTGGPELDMKRNPHLRDLPQFPHELQKAGFFHIGTLVQVGSETPAGALVSGDSDEDFINVPVSFPVYYQESWTVEPSEATLLAAIGMTIQYVARQWDGSLLVPGSVDQDGNPVEGSDGVIIQAWTLP